MGVLTATNHIMCVFRLRIANPGGNAFGRVCVSLYPIHALTYESIDLKLHFCMQIHFHNI